MERIWKSRYDPERTAKRYMENGLLSKDDYSLIKNYIAFKGLSNVSDTRKNQLLQVLTVWKRWIHVDYRQLTFEDVTKSINEFTSSKPTQQGVGDMKTNPGKEFSVNTLHTYESILKGFLLYLSDEDLIKVSIKDLKKIKPPAVDNDTKNANEILSPDDIKVLLAKAPGSMNKAFIAVLWESGARPQEVCSIKWADIKPDDHGMRLHITDVKQKNKKTKTRFALLTLAAPYLSQWKEESDHLKDNDFVFQVSGKPLKYGAMRMRIDRLSKKLGKKKVWPYLFRSSCVTNMIVNKYPESVIREQVWGNQGSVMLDTYLKMDEEKVYDMVLAARGIKKQDQVKYELAPIECHNCHTSHGPDSKYCRICGFPISKEAILAKKDAIEAIEKDPAMETILRRLNELQASNEALKIKVDSMKN